MEITVPEPFKLPLTQNTNPAEVNNLSVITAGEINDEPNEDIDSLIDKVRQVTSRYKKDVDGTIAEVQQILEADYSLPRLTRGEIVEILDNLTKTDIDSLRQGNKDRKDYQKALMLVMPYTSKDSPLNVEELYTKPPITHIVGSHVVKQHPPKKNVEIMKETSTLSAIEISPVEESTLRIKTTSKSTLKPRRKRPIKYTPQPKPEIKEQELIITESQPYVSEITPGNPINIEITTAKPKKQFIMNKSTPKPDFVASTHRPVYSKPTRYSNHKYQEEEFKPSNGFRIVNPPSFSVTSETEEQKPVIIAESWQQDSGKNWEQKVPARKRPPTRGSMQSSVYKAPLSTIRPRQRTTTTTTQPSVVNIDLPEDMKDFVKELQLAEPSIKKNKYSSHYVASETNFKKPTSTENIQEILGAIGGLTTTTKMPDLTGVADTLTPDMKELLMSFGLITDPNSPSTTTTQLPMEPEVVDIKPMSYTQFKPLPDDAPSRDDMFDFLSSFGLIGSRSAKKIKEENEPKLEQPKQLSEVPHIDMEMIPESMHGVLEDIGLTQSNRRGKRIETNEASKTSSTKISEKTHVFNPAESNVSTEQLRRLNKLMETLVRLEKLNRTVTEADFKDVDLENIAEITKILNNNDKVIPLDAQNGPDPIKFDPGLEKNEVKRQETTTKKEEETTTEEPKNPPISALEESFGGGVTTKAEDATLPPPRKTGFYYLVDWNTFLEVGEEGKNRVNIRFSPRAGDPSRFLKVTVP